LWQQIPGALTDECPGRTDPALWMGLCGRDQPSERAAHSSWAIRSAGGVSSTRDLFG
jgi:hypothetical protein